MAQFGLAAAALALAQPAALAQQSKSKPAASAKADSRKTDSKSARTAKTTAKEAPGKSDAKSAAPGKPTLVATFGDWGVYSAVSGKNKTCYALGQPKDRQPAKLKRDPAYVFISNRPAEGVRNEISIIMGFDVKPSDDLKADIGNQDFDMVAKGANLWVKNAAEEGRMVDAMKKGSRLVVKALSLRGNLTTDSYSLSGLSQAVDRMSKECQ
jgi:hypothetical protein